MLVDSALSPLPHIAEEPRQAIALLVFDSQLVSLVDTCPSKRSLVWQLGNMLTKLGWQVDIFTGLAKETTIIVRQSSFCRLIGLAAERTSPDLSRFIAAFLKFQSQQGINYPIIHSFDPLAGWIGCQLKKQIDLQFVHTCDCDVAANFQKLERQTAQAADRILVTVERIDGTRKCSRLPTWLPKEKVEVIPKSTEPNKLRRSPPKAMQGSLGDFYGLELNSSYSPFAFSHQPYSSGLKRHQEAIAAKLEINISPTELVILYVGQFTAPASLETVIQAFNNCSHVFPQARLMLIEQNELSSVATTTKQYLQDLVQYLNIAEKVLFAGLVQPTLLPLYYMAADVCLIPSLESPLSKTALEAAAWDIPAIAKNEPSWRFTIASEMTGLLLSSSNIAAWQQAISSVLTSRSDLAKPKATISAEAKMAIYLSYLYRWLLTSTLTPIEWIPPIVPWSKAIAKEDKVTSNQL